MLLVVLVCIGSFLRPLKDNTLDSLLTSLDEADVTGKTYSPLCKEALAITLSLYLRVPPLLVKVNLILSGSLYRDIRLIPNSGINKQLLRGSIALFILI